MAGNTSTAVRASRKNPVDDLDFFPTHPWATRALFEYVLKRRPVIFPLGRSRVWEPACGRGDMARPIAEYVGEVFASDVYDYGHGEIFDFLSLNNELVLQMPPEPVRHGVDWIITNPPFNNLLEFFEIAWRMADVGVAMLMRTQALEGIDRYNQIYEPFRGRYTWAQFVERVPMCEGRLDPKGGTATAYGWLVVQKHGESSPLIHIPPCRSLFERPGDYDNQPEPGELVERLSV